jgi:hypothetical protein
MYISLEKPVKDMSCPAYFSLLTIADNILYVHGITIILKRSVVYERSAGAPGAA